MSTKITRLAACLALLLLPASHAQATLITSLSLQSEPGDFVGGGKTVFLDQSNGDFFAFRTLDNGVSIGFSGFAPGNFWSLHFVAPMDELLQIGIYEDATRWPFQLPTDPGLSVFGDGRGCNLLTGRFEVSEVAFGPGTTVNSFAATFEQHCEMATAPALFGQIRFNSLQGIPEPSTLALFAFGVAGLGFVGWRSGRKEQV